MLLGGARAKVAPPPAVGAGGGDHHAPSAASAASEALQQRGALGGGAAALAAAAGVGAQPVLGGEVVRPADVAGVMVGQADAPFADRQQLGPRADLPVGDDRYSMPSVAASARSL